MKFCCEPVILSEVVVREADDGAVEGPLSQGRGALGILCPDESSRDPQRLIWQEVSFDCARRFAVLADALRSG